MQIVFKSYHVVMTPHNYTVALTIAWSLADIINSALGSASSPVSFKKFSVQENRQVGLKS